ncbi:MAG: hypothetical protein EXQ52_09145 [Bryobacterales bacterium]|nr:hypothetical protein [Bryobacterales bacterium]
MKLNATWSGGYCLRVQNGECFSPFFGTSASAPHAAAVAALVKGAKFSVTGAQVYSALTSTALDIRAPGIDRDSGHGIVIAPGAVNAILH